MDTFCLAMKPNRYPQQRRSNKKLTHNTNLNSWEIKAQFDNCDNIPHFSELPAKLSVQ